MNKKCTCQMCGKQAHPYYQRHNIDLCSRHSDAIEIFDDGWNIGFNRGINGPQGNADQTNKIMLEDFIRMYQVLNENKVAEEVK